VRIGCASHKPNLVRRPGSSSVTSAWTLIAIRKRIPHRDSPCSHLERLLESRTLERAVAGFDAVESAAPSPIGVAHGHSTQHLRRRVTLLRSRKACLCGHQRSRARWLPPCQSQCGRWRRTGSLHQGRRETVFGWKMHRGAGISVRASSEPRSRAPSLFYDWAGVRWVWTPPSEAYLVTRSVEEGSRTARCLVTPRPER